MTRERGPLPDDELGADLEPVWDRLAEHASMAPAAGAQLHARVQAAIVTESEQALRPARLRPYVVIRPLVRPSSIRSLTAAAALVALLGASVALAGAGVARLNEAPAVVPTPTPTAEQATDDEEDTGSPAPIVQPPVRPRPSGTDDHGAAKTPEPSDDERDDEDDDAKESDEPDEDRDDDEPSDDPSHEPDDEPDDEPSDDGDPDEDEPEDEDPDS